MLINDIRRISQMVLPLPRAYMTKGDANEIADQTNILLMPGCRALDAYISPDFGWNAAMSLYRFGLHRNGFFDGRSQWIHIAAICLERGLDRESPDPRLSAVQWAWKIRHDTKLQAMRHTLEGALVIADATREGTAASLGMPLDVVEAYETLFWNVIDRSADLTYLQTIVYPEGRLEEVISGFIHRANMDKLLRRLGYNSGIVDLSWGAGLRLSPVNSTSISVAKEQNERLTLSLGALMLRNFGHFHDQHPQVVSSRQLISAAKIGGIDDSTEGGDDDFSQFAESLLGEDVEWQQEKIRKKQKLEEQRRKQSA